MVQRNLLYTGVTRCKRLVVPAGQKKAVAMAGRSVSGRLRWSKLRECRSRLLQQKRGRREWTINIYAPRADRTASDCGLKVQRVHRL
jgi:hypothetical protein